MTTEQLKFANDIQDNLYNLHWLERSTKGDAFWSGTPDQFDASIGNALRSLLKSESFKTKFLEFIRTETDINNEIFKNL